MIKKEAERNEARKLRRKGNSVREISRKLEVSQSSVSLWVRDIRLTQEQKDVLLARKYNGGIAGCRVGTKSAQTKALKVRRSYQYQGREDAKQGDLLHAQACMLYWAEGSKDRNLLRLGNTDPNILRMFVRCLKEFFEVEAQNIRLTIRGYSNNGVSEKRLLNYWTKTLELPTESVKSIKIDWDKRKRSGKRKNVHKFGIAEVAVCSTELVQRLFGAIQEYGEFENPAWVL